MFKSILTQHIAKIKFFTFEQNKSPY